MAMGSNMQKELNSFLNDLNTQQKEAVVFGNGPLLIIAGAGTGKTTVITKRIAYLIKNKIAKPDQILALTFTEKAAGEMQDRVLALLDDSFYLDLWVSTFHSFCDRVLRERGLDIGLPINYKLLTETQAQILMRNNLEKFDLDYYRPIGNPTSFIGALVTHFSRCKDMGIYPEHYLEYADKLKTELIDLPVKKKPKVKKGLSQEELDNLEIEAIEQERQRINEVARAYAIYQKLLLDNNYLDFGDLISYCYQLFIKRPGILAQYQERFQYVLIDEFQDTNWMQYQLAKIMASPQNNLTVVADDDQSIYKFRGAAYTNILAFVKDYPESKKVSLIQNYRSPQNILDLAYQAIQNNNPDRLEAQQSDICKQLVSNIKGDGMFECLHAKTGEQEAMMVAEKIKEILETDKEAEFSDFLILARANSHAPIFLNALNREQIPCQFLASQGLFLKPLVVDMLSYLRLANNCKENVYFFRLINCPVFGIDYEDISKIIKNSDVKRQDYWEILKNIATVKDISQDAVAKIKNIAANLAKHAQLAKDKNISEVFISFIKDTGFLNHVIQQAKSDPILASENLDLLNQFYEKIKEFENNNSLARLANFINQIDLEIEAGDLGVLQISADIGSSVKIMTVHAAKGLEFKYVFIVNLIAGRFPKNRRGDTIAMPDALNKETKATKDEHLEEERRLFYVALTRAKKGLFLLWSDDYGGKQYTKPSPFLQEIGCSAQANLLKKKDLSLILEQKKAKTKASEISFVLPDHFSFSQLAAYQRCPYQYKLNFLYKVPQGGSAATTFGRVLHDTLYQFIKECLQNSNTEQTDLFDAKKASNKEILLPVERLLEIYEQNWSEDWYDDKVQREDYHKQGKEQLKAVYDDFRENGINVYCQDDQPFLEKDFKIKIGQDTLIGKIDRINQLKTGGVEIVDYKTGKPDKKPDKDKRAQLLLYYLAAKEYLGLEPELLTFYYLTDGSKFNFIPDDKELQQAQESIKETIESIKSLDFHAEPSEFNCQYCDFKDICDFRGK